MAKRGNGEGSIYYSEKLNRWVGQFTAGRKANGKLNRKTIYGKTRKEVSEKIKQKQFELKNDTFIEKNNISLIEIIDLCIEQLKASNTIKQVSYNRKQQSKKIIMKTDIAYSPIQKITIQDINLSLNSLINYSNSVIDKVYGLLHQAYNYAILNNYINKNYFSIKGAIIKPISNKQDKEIEALTIEEQDLLQKELLCSDDPYKNIIYIALYSGMRIGEILALKAEDIDLKNNIIRVNKTLTRDEKENFIVGDTTKTYAGKREIPIFKNLTQIVTPLSNENDFLFQTESNKFIRPSTINTHFKKICKKAGIKPIYKTKLKNGKELNVLYSSNVNTHMLRHTFATRCIEAGMSPVVLQKILGHKNVEVTLNTYTSVFNKYKEDEIKKVENYLVALKLH